MTNKELNEAIAIARAESRWEYVETVVDYDKPAIRERRLLPEPKPRATDMNMAMELVDEWKKDTGQFAAFWEVGMKWQVGYKEPKRPARASTLPRAICKAWLAWMGGEI